MLASINLLKKFVDLEGLTPEEIADRLTFAGLEVEGIEHLAEANNLVIGQIKEVKNHPDSDHLHVLQVDEGEKYGVKQIVCGAPNVREGLKVIVALPGAQLPAKDITISKSTIRGVESNGMCCALNELGVDKLFLREEQISGIEELPDDAPVGEEKVLEYLGLDDVILDINVLANRSDCLALYSVAKELSALFDRKLLIEEPTRYDEIKTDVKVSSSTENCKQFSIKVVKDVVTKASPDWLVKALMAQGIRSINNIVDIGNYVMVLTGQPIHMYDLDKLKSHEFIVKDDFEGEIVCLDEKTYKLEKGDLVVTNKNQVVCLAGIMGVLDVAVDENTKNIAIESANFLGSRVRRTSARLGLTSESSQHFVKGINPHQDELVLNLSADLLVKLAEAKVVEESSRYKVIDETKKVIHSSVKYINNRLGTNFGFELISSILNKLQIKTTSVNGNEFISVIPDHRIDITSQADLSEEVIRYVGFDHIKSVLPLMETTTGGYTEAQLKRLKIREHLISNGLNEALTYTLVSPEENKKFTLLNNDEPYVIMNPMTVDHSEVRKSLINSLLNVVNYNLNHQQEDLAYFEIAQINTLSESYEELGIVLNGSVRERGILKKRAYDFYDALGLFDSIFNLLCIEKNRYKLERLTDSQFYHPGRAVKVLFGKKVVGVIGEIHPNYDKDLVNTYIVDLNLTEVINLKVSATKMNKISRFTTNTRDLALVVKKEVLAEDLIRTIKKFSKSIVSEVNVFDVYEGTNIPAGYKSIAISLSFSSLEKTLQDNEINDVMQSITNELYKAYKAEVRK